MNNSDILSEVFSTLRLRSQLYFEADLRGDFSIEVPRQQRLIRFHLVRQGQCCVTVPGSKTIRLGENDLAIIPNGVEQIISMQAGTPPVSLQQLLQDGACADGVLTHGDGANVTRLLCGFCQFDEDIDHPVIANLPNLLIVRPSELGAEPWASSAISLLALESNLKAPGMAGILSRLLEIVFIQAMRRTAPEHGSNDFIAALADAQLSRALNAIHAQPQSTWTIKALAELAGMSRGRFAHKFTQMVGSTPIGYLTNWRLMKARTLLADTTLDMAEIAERCGYKSVPSFTRRFKKAFQVGPGGFRRSARRP